MRCGQGNHAQGFGKRDAGPVSLIAQGSENRPAETFASASTSKAATRPTAKLTTAATGQRFKTG